MEGKEMDKKEENTDDQNLIAKMIYHWIRVSDSYDYALPKSKWELCIKYRKYIDNGHFIFSGYDCGFCPVAFHTVNGDNCTNTPFFIWQIETDNFIDSKRIWADGKKLQKIAWEFKKYLQDVLEWLQGKYKSPREIYFSKAKDKTF